MIPWVRVLLILGAAVAAALLLRAVPSWVVLALFVGIVVYINNRFRRAVPRTPKSDAEVLGLKRETDDPFGILGYPLALFARGSDTAIDEVVWGTWNGLDVRVFGASFPGPALPGHPAERSSFACALTRLEAELPAVVVEPTTFVTRIERAPTAPAVEIDDSRFQVAFHVWSEDAGFARGMLAPPLRDWLGSLDPRFGVEVHGRIAMVYGPRQDQLQVASILAVLREFLDQLPNDALAAHPPPFEDGRTAS